MWCTRMRMRTCEHVRVYASYSKQACPCLCTCTHILTHRPLQVGHACVHAHRTHIPLSSLCVRRRGSPPPKIAALPSFLGHPCRCTKHTGRPCARCRGRRAHGPSHPSSRTIASTRWCVCVALVLGGSACCARACWMGAGWPAYVCGSQCSSSQTLPGPGLEQPRPIFEAWPGSPGAAAGCCAQRQLRLREKPWPATDIPTTSLLSLAAPA